MSGKTSDEHSSTDDWTDAILAIAETGTYTIVPTSPVYCYSGSAIDLADPTSYTIYAIAVANATAAPTPFTTNAAGPGCADILATTALSTVLRPIGLQAAEAATETTISANSSSPPICDAVAAYNTSLMPMLTLNALTPSPPPPSSSPPTPPPSPPPPLYISEYLPVEQADSVIDYRREICASDLPVRGGGDSPRNPQLLLPRIGDAGRTNV
ncbi:hypothetical protein SprV_0200612900 [Sparganum proliferum]